MIISTLSGIHKIWDLEGNFIMISDEKRLKFSRDDQYSLRTSGDGSVGVFDSNDHVLAGFKNNDLEGPNLEISDLRVNIDGSFALVKGNETLEIWDIRKQTLSGWNTRP